MHTRSRWPQRYSLVWWLALIVLALLATQGALLGPAGAQQPAKDEPQIGEGVFMEVDALSLLATGCGGPAPAPMNEAFEWELVRLINLARADIAARDGIELLPLKRTPALDQAARYHAFDMAEDGYFGNDTYDPGTPDPVFVCRWDQRLATYYTGKALGQNSAKNYPNPESVVAAWLGQTKERYVITNEKIREIGVGYYMTAEWESYWVVNVGMREDVYPLIIDHDAPVTNDLTVSLAIYGEWDEMRLSHDGGTGMGWQDFRHQIPDHQLERGDPGLRTVWAELSKSIGGIDTRVTVSDTIYYRPIPVEPTPDPTSIDSTFYLPLIWRPVARPQDGYIVFQSNRDGNWEIYLLNVATGAEMNLTDNPADDQNPLPSHDGMTVVFESDRDGETFELYALPILSYIPGVTWGAPERLTANGADDYGAGFSPRDRKVLFESEQSGNRDIYVVGRNGVGQFQLTFDPAVDTQPDWSPITSTVVFETYRDGPQDIEIYGITFTETVDDLILGPGPYNLTRRDFAHDRNPAWSPVGDLIAFDSEDLLYTNTDIYVMNPDGRNQRRLTTHPASDSHPTWAPDGQAIAFCSWRDETAEIYTVKADGMGEPVRLTRNRTIDGWRGDLSWSPDGEWVAFSGLDTLGGQDIYMARSDGSLVEIRLTSSSGSDWNPRWIIQR
jgi:Tol biopolymer transport system component/uncharacterized protein YkwD